LFVVGRGTDERTFGIKPIGHEQLGQAVAIPKPYYERMQASAPALLRDSVNTWLKEEPKAKNMLRTMDGQLRAVRSDTFRALDNPDFAEAILPVLFDVGAEPVSVQITEKRLYIKAVCKNAQREVMLQTQHKIGDGSHAFYKDIVCPAIVCSNSEVGAGSVAVLGSVYTSGCTNLAVQKENSMRKYHVGARHEVGDSQYAMLSDRTKMMTDAATWAQVRDVVKGAFDMARFDGYVAKLQGAAEVPMTGDPVKIVAAAGKMFGLTDVEQSSILKHLMMGGHGSKYGLHAAITRMSADVESYDRASELERMGGDVIELSRHEWTSLEKMAA
jgi:hypothetical protein